MSEIKRMQEDYRELWNSLKNMLKSFYIQTNEDKKISEKQLYDDILSIMILMENKVGEDNE